MLHLTLAGLSEDDARLLLVSDAGEKFSLAVDAKLRAALRGEHARLGQLEIQMDSALRPRDIQTRIRAGETPEAVAQAAQTTIDKILPYANPVLAERAHIAARAQRSSVRRAPGDATSGGARTLGDAVTSMLRSQNVDPASVEWDAWRREDGRWTLVAAFATAKRKGTATFTFDAPGNYITLEDDDARWLVGEAVASATQAPAPPDDLQQARRRRLQSVPEDELPLGEDALGLVSEEPVQVVEVVEVLEVTEVVEATAEEPSTYDDQGIAQATGHDDPDLAPTPEPLADQPVATRPTRKKGRASVPSWDEIMFGGGKHD